MTVDVALALAAALAATLFTADLTRDFIRNHRSHVAAYATGMAMFATASASCARSVSEPSPEITKTMRRSPITAEPTRP